MARYLEGTCTNTPVMFEIKQLYDHLMLQLLIFPQYLAIQVFVCLRVGLCNCLVSSLLAQIEEGLHNYCFKQSNLIL